MTAYSHSRLSTFEQCKYRYKLQYIDKIRPDFQTTVEAFMGDMVHRTLQKLYKELNFDSIDTIFELLEFYGSEWEKNWTDDILIVKKDMTMEDYRIKGAKFVSEYYRHYYPFDDLTVLGLETKEYMALPDGNRYHIRIDKLGRVDNDYYVCDYKTGSWMKDPNQLKYDRQLGMYSLWVRQKFPDARRIFAKWHMLAFDKELINEIVEDQMNKVQQETLSLISLVEQTTEFPTNVGPLCNYCGFKERCPEFGKS